MSPRVTREDDRILLELEPFEHDLLLQLPAALRALLDDPDRDDPAVRRLFPRVAPEDEDVDEEVRAMIHDDLLQQRLDAVSEVAALLEGAERRRGRLEIELDGEGAALVLGVLNDVRLTLGARVGIEHLDRRELPEDHPAAQPLALMDHLAWIQEQLIAALDPVSIRGDEPDQDDGDDGE